MKINSIGINAYQEMAGKAQANKKPVETTVTNQVQKADKIKIPGRTDRIGSDLSIKLEGEEYADLLSPEEKQALELLFEKYGGKRGSLNSNANNQQLLGTFVDVKL